MDIHAQFALTLAAAIALSVTTFIFFKTPAGSRTHASLSRFVFSPQSIDRAVIGLVLAYIVVFSYLSVMAHLSFHAGDDLDLGQYDQLIWNSLNGRLLENTILFDAPFFLGKSFTPILLAFVPLYAIWASPIVLLVFQTIALACGAFPIYWLARERIGRGLALVVVFSYLLSPLVQYINLANFHEIALATPVLAYATFFLLRRHYAGLAACLAVSLLIKEEMGLVVIGFGLYLAILQRKRLAGIGLAVFGLAWTVVLLQYLIPYWHGSMAQGFYYFSSGSVGGGGSRYDYLGRSVPEILTTILTRPGYVLEYLLMPGKVEYVLYLLVPLVLTPLVGVEVLALASSTVAISLLSNYKWQYSIQTAYPSALVPFLFFGAAIGLARILKWRQSSALDRRARAVSLGILILVGGVASYYFDGPGPLSVNFDAGRYAMNEHTALGDRLIDLVPKDATVVAQNEFIGHFSNRQYVYNIAVIPNYRQADFLFFDKTLPWYDIHKDYWSYFLGSGYFQVIAEKEGYVVAKRRVPVRKVQAQFLNGMILEGFSVVPAGPLKGGALLRPVLEWTAERPIHARYHVALQLTDSQGHVWANENREPQDGNESTTAWIPGRSVGDQYNLSLPPTMPAGSYELSLVVSQVGAGDAVAARDSQGKSLGDRIVLDHLRVEKNTDSFTAQDLSEIPVRLYVDMAEMRLLGYVPPPETVAPGDPFQIGLYWRAREKPLADYLVAVQLLDSQRRVALDQVNRPASGVHPTQTWNKGEVLLDWHDLTIPSGLAPGEYDVVVLLRNAWTKEQVGIAAISKLVIEH